MKESWDTGVIMSTSMPTLEPFCNTDFKSTYEHALPAYVQAFAEANTRLREIAADIWVDPDAAVALFDKRLKERGSHAYLMARGYHTLATQPQAFGPLKNAEAAKLARNLVEQQLAVPMLHFVARLMASTQSLLASWERNKSV